MRRFGELLSDRMTERKISPAGLAAALGIATTRRVERWIAGTTRADRAWRLRCIEALRVPQRDVGLWLSVPDRPDEVIP
jgi:plasmid maintenance system antidote protein VapI